MRSPALGWLMPALLSPALALGAGLKEPIQLLDKTSGNADLAQFQVDAAPGTVSAADLLGLEGDQLSTLENPRDFTLLFKLARGNVGGLAVTPARTSLLPLSVQAYHANPMARLWGGTTFAYAQGQATVGGKNYQQRAWSVETTVHLQPQLDDPLVVYWDLLRRADAHPHDKDDSCVKMRAQLPNGTPAPDPSTPTAPSTAAASAPGASSAAPKPVVPATAPPDLAAQMQALADACHNLVTTKLRWNASRLWLSVADGRYQAVDGAGGSRGLGRRVVLGVSLGLGGAGARTAGLLTLAARHSTGEPTLDSYDAAEPTRRSTQLLTFRAAVGSRSGRFLLEASNHHDASPTAQARTYKRAFGADLKLREGIWLNLRAGKQRRIDGQGDETGSTLGISLNPDALIKL